MREDLIKWQALMDKPVINADIRNWCQTEMNPNRVSDLKNQADRARDFIESISSLINEPWFIGWHWCAHVENKARGWGIKDPYDEYYYDFINPVKEFEKTKVNLLVGRFSNTGNVLYFLFFVSR